MARLFNFDNPVWRFMGRVADVFLLTVLWAACSLPVITAGASTSALYYVTLKMAGNKEGYLCRSFFKAFKDNFWQATGVWLILIAVSVFLGADLYFLQVLHAPSERAALVGGAAAFAFWFLLVTAVVCLFVAVLIFPLEARLDAGVKKLFALAFMVSMKNFSWVMLMIVATVCIAALGVFVFWPLLLVGAGATAYIHSVILERAIFPKYGWNEAD